MHRKHRESGLSDRTAAQGHQRRQSLPEDNRMVSRHGLESRHRRFEFRRPVAVQGWFWFSDHGVCHGKQLREDCAKSGCGQNGEVVVIPGPPLKHR